MYIYLFQSRFSPPLLLRIGLPVIIISGMVRQFLVSKNDRFFRNGIEKIPVMRNNYDSLAFCFVCQVRL